MNKRKIIVGVGRTGTEAAKAFLEQYRPGSDFNEKFAGDYARIKAMLNAGPVTLEQFHSVIDSESWTKELCMCCAKHVSKAAYLEDDYEAHAYCRDCLLAAAEALA